MSATSRVAPVFAILAVAACAPAAEQRPAAESAGAVAVGASAAGASATADGRAAAGSGDAARRVTPRGIGPVRAGMTLAEAAAATGGALAAPAGADPRACGYAAWRGAPAGVRVMVEAGSIARIDVDSAGVPTDAGAGVGDAEARVESLYAGRVRATPHKYTRGRYLTVTPAAPADSAYRIVFETDGRRVTRYRAGRRPPVEYVEGCG